MAILTVRARLSLAVISLLALVPHLLLAQVPSAQQIQSALQNPSNIAALRQQINASGLSPEQIRSRLQAAGYPSSLLDAYLPGGDTTGTRPTNDVLSAVRFLGLVDSSVVSAGQAHDSAEAAGRRTAAEVSAAEVPGKRLFGLDVFRRSTSQFEPDIAGPVDANYQVGPRDVLALILTGGIETSYTLEVTREGFIVIPQVGQVYVANLTLSQIENVLFERLKRVYSGIGRDPGASTHFYVTVARLRTNQVFVIGDAVNPGSYQVSSAGTMLTALYAAGGPSDDGSLRNVQLRRNGKTVADLDVYDYLLRGDASRDVRLQTGDVVFVPVHGPRVEITGEVIRPATYELAQGETLRDLLQAAGGFTASADRSRILIRRIVAPADRPVEGGRDRTVLDVKSPELATSYGPPVPLQRGDEVEVFAISDRVRNHVVVSGAVWNPGSEGFTTGMTLSDAIRFAGGVKPDVHDVLISRLRSDQVREELRASFADTLGHLVHDMPLQEDDSIVVYAQRDFRPDRWVAITGSVRNGGRYPWHAGMTLRDLVHLAHGFEDGAYLVNARVARMPADRSRGQLATTLTVPLDSSYLLERGLDGSYSGPPGIQVTANGVPDFVLQPYDNILILRQPDWQLERTVTLEGEVRFPGEYALVSKQERISELLKQAGGLMPSAYPEGAMFRRGSDSVGRVALELAAALSHPGSREDFVLLPGDTLIVPRYRPTVRIEGAVNSPITLAYTPGWKLTDYVDGAGGARFDADMHRAYVRQPDGVVDPYRSRPLLLPNHNPEPVAGSTIVVPTRDPNAKKDWTSIAGSVAQVVASSIAVLVLVLRR